MEMKNSYTRKIDKEFNKILFASWAIGSDENGKPTFSIWPEDMAKANDYLVKEIYWLTDEELDNLDVNEYDMMLEKINNMKKSGSK